MQLMKEKQDLSYLSWSVYRNSSGTAGSFLKAYSELGGTKTYYKLSYFDKARGIIGHECVNELIVDRLLTILGIPHLSYQLIHADVTVDGKAHEVYLCVSEDFKAKSESKIALDAYKELEALPDESALEFCSRMGWEDYIYLMLVVDYLILNRDRHAPISRYCATAERRQFVWRPCLTMDFRFFAAVPMMQRRQNSM